MRVQVAFAHDSNGGYIQMVPRFGADACKSAPRAHRLRQRRLQKGRLGTDFDTKGFAHVAMYKDVLTDLRNLGVDTRNLDASAEAFLRMWERGDDSLRGPLPDDVDLRGIE